MPVRCSLLLAVTTDPTDKVAASPHSGGWSESFWIAGNTFLDQATFAKWAQARANLLAGECSIVGYRQQVGTIEKNRLLPGGSGSETLNIPGAYANDMGAPQDAVMVAFQLAGQPSGVRHRLAGLPDSQVTRGEYQPNSAFKAQMTNYVNLIVNGAFGAVVRDLSKPDCRVKSIAGAVITTLTATGAVQGDYIRLRRVKDDNDKPVEGSFLVQSVVTPGDGTTQYTVFPAPGQTVSRPNGTARLDVLTEANIISGNASRLVVRKVGRPFSQYRGRRSKVRR